MDPESSITNTVSKVARKPNWSSSAEEAACGVSAVYGGGTSLGPPILKGFDGEEYVLEVEPEAGNEGGTKCFADLSYLLGSAVWFFVEEFERVLLRRLKVSILLSVLEFCLDCVEGEWLVLQKKLLKPILRPASNSSLDPL